MRRTKIQATLAVIVALGAYLHFDPASPWDPFHISDPKPDATPERRATMMREYDHLLEDPWGTTNEATREGVVKMQTRVRDRWPEEFPQ
jgi:hypothetical protein